MGYTSYHSLKTSRSWSQFRCRIPAFLNACFHVVSINLVTFLSLFILVVVICVYSLSFARRRFRLGLRLLVARGMSRLVPTHFGECCSDTFRIWARQSKLTHDAIDSTRKRVFQIFTYLHLDRRVRLVFIQRLGTPQEHPHDVFMRFVGCVSVEGLVVSASREDAVRTYAMNFRVWPIERPVKREEADRPVHALDGAF